VIRFDVPGFVCRSRVTLRVGEAPGEMPVAAAATPLRTAVVGEDQAVRIFAGNAPAAVHAIRGRWLVDSPAACGPTCTGMNEGWLVAAATAGDAADGTMTDVVAFDLAQMGERLRITLAGVASASVRFDLGGLTVIGDDGRVLAVDLEAGGAGATRYVDLRP
jgi:hypothetical protein